MIKLRVAVGSVRRRNTDEPVLSTKAVSSEARRNTNATGERPRMGIYQGPQGEQTGLGMFDEFGETPPVAIAQRPARSPVTAPPANPPSYGRQQGASGGTGVLDEWVMQADGLMLDARGNPMKTTIAKMQSLRESPQETQDVQLTNLQAWPKKQPTHHQHLNQFLSDITPEPLAIPKLPFEQHGDFDAGSPEADRVNTSDSKTTYDTTISTEPISPNFDQSSTRATSLFSTSPNLSRMPNPKLEAPALPAPLGSKHAEPSQQIMGTTGAPAPAVQADEKNDVKAIPPKKMSIDLPRQSSTIERPSSRRSDRVMNLVRPRGSMDSVRSSYSERLKASGWGLFRRNSRDANRPASADGHRKATGSRSATSQGIKDFQIEKPAKVNMNRKLPPLPSLDTWNDTTEPEQVVHIASMVSPARAHQSIRPVVEDARKSPVNSASKFSEDIDNIMPVVSTSPARSGYNHNAPQNLEHGQYEAKKQAAVKAQENSLQGKASADHVELVHAVPTTVKPGFGSKLARLLGRRKKSMIKTNGCAEEMRDATIVRNNEGIA